VPFKWCARQSFARPFLPNVEGAGLCTDRLAAKPFSEINFRKAPHPIRWGENYRKNSCVAALNLTTPLPSLSSPSEGEERVAAGRERSGPGSVHGQLNDSKIAHRGHESVARLGAPACLPASFRTHTATRRQGCRRSQFRFVGSLDLQLWTRIAAMKRGVWEADPCLSAEIGRTQSAGKSSGSVSSQSLCSILRFMERRTNLKFISDTSALIALPRTRRLSARRCPCFAMQKIRV